MRVRLHTLAAALTVIFAVTAQQPQVSWTTPSAISFCPGATASWSWTLEPTPPDGSEVHWQLVKTSGGDPLDQGTGNSVTWIVKNVAVGDSLVVRLNGDEQSEAVLVVACPTQPAETTNETPSPTPPPEQTMTSAQETPNLPTSSSTTTTEGHSPTTASPAPSSDQPTTAATFSTSPSQTQQSSTPVTTTTVQSSVPLSPMASASPNGSSSATPTATTSERSRGSPAGTAVTVTKTLLSEATGSDAVAGQQGSPGRSGLSSGGIAGVVIGVLLGVSAVVALAVCCVVRRGQNGDPVKRASSFGFERATWSPMPHSSTSHSQFMSEPAPLVPSLPPNSDSDPFYAVDRSQRLSRSSVGESEEYLSPTRRM